MRDFDNWTWPDHELIQVIWWICRSHEFISLNRAYLGWVLAKLLGKLHKGTIGLCIRWKLQNLMHHRRQCKENPFNLLNSLRSNAIENMFTFVKSSVSQTYLVINSFWGQKGVAANIPRTCNSSKHTLEKTHFGEDIVDGENEQADNPLVQNLQTFSSHRSHLARWVRASGNYSVWINWNNLMTTPDHLMSWRSFFLLSGAQLPPRVGQRAPLSQASGFN